MALNISDVMDKLGASVKGLGGLRVYDYPPKSAQPPFAFLNMPESIDYDLTMGRGFDRVTIQMFLGVTDVIDRAARDAIVAYAAGSGVLSVKSAVESAELGAMVRVTRAEFGQITLASGSYVGVIFTIDVAA